MSNDVAIIGIGLHPFGKFEGKTALDMAVDAIQDALKDAGIEWKDIQCAYGGSWHGGMGDSLVSRLGPTGIPFVNVFNGCATAGSALTGVTHLIRLGEADIGLAVGFDKHERGMFAAEPDILGLPEWYADVGLMTTVQFFAMKTQRYMYDYNISKDCLIEVSIKNWFNGSLNPKAWRRKAFTREEIEHAMVVNDPFTKYMVCSPSEGAAAMVLCRADMARRFTSKPIYIKASVLRTRKYESFEVFNPCVPIGKLGTPVELASKAAFEQAGVDPKDIQIAQVQDAEAGHEIMHMAETGLCQHGEQEKLIKEGATRINGRLPINTDGGLMANGEPVGASGLRQVYEVCLQMRGEAGPRQVQNDPKLGLCQVYGAPGVSNVVILQK